MLNLSLRPSKLLFPSKIISKKTSRYCHSPVRRHRLRRRRRAKNLTFSNLSVITEDIYILETHTSCFKTIKRGTHTRRGGNPHFYIVIPLFDIEFS